MTEHLTDLLRTRADAPEFDPPDLGVIVAEGGRRRRRRRTAHLGAGLAVLAVIGGAGVLAIGGGEDERADDPASTAGLGDTAVTWVTGSTLHTPTGQVDLGHQVAVYVQNADGIVFADPDGVVWAQDGSDYVRKGSLDPDRPELVTDDSGHLVVWADRSGCLQGVDLRRRVAICRSTRDDETPLAVDGDTVYVQGASGNDAVDSRSGDRLRVSGPSTDVLAAHDGLVAFDPESDYTRIGTSPSEARTLDGIDTSLGSFSPGGGWFSADEDQPAVVDTETLARVDLDTDDEFATGFRWLDDDTLLLIAATVLDADDADRSTAKLVTCEIPAGECRTVVDDLGTFDDLAAGDVVLPTGRPADS